MVAIDDVLSLQGVTHPCVPIQLLVSFGFFILGLGTLETSTLLPVPLYGCWSAITVPELSGNELCENVLLFGPPREAEQSMISACGSHSWWQRLAWAGSLLTVGRMLLCIAAGIGSDVFGRRRSVIVWMGSYFVFAFIRSFAPMVEVFVMCITMEAICSQAATISLLLIATEGSTQKECVRSACLVLLGHAIGVSVGIPVVNLYVRNETFRQLSRSLPSVAFILFIFFLPESIRWVVTQGRLEDIHETIKMSHKISLEDAAKPKIAAVYPQMRKELSDCRSRGNPLTQSVLPLFLSKALWRVTFPFILISALVGSAIGFRLLYDPLPYHSIEDRVLTSGVAELLAVQLLGLLSARLPVRRVLATLAAFYSIAIMLTRILREAGITSCVGNVFLASGGHFMSVLIWIWIVLGVIRLTPTHSRGALLGITISFGTLGHAFAMLIYESLNWGSFYPGFLFASAVAIAGFLSLLLPPTPSVLPDMMSHIAPYLFWNNDVLPSRVQHHRSDENTRL